jgi:hypothetical protein
MALHPDIAARRADHEAHRAYLIPECRDCTSPAAIAARRGIALSPFTRRALAAQLPGKVTS